MLSLPAEISPVIRPTLPGLVEEIIDAIREGVPVYARPFEGRFGEAVRRGTEVALSSFLGCRGRRGRPSPTRPATSTRRSVAGRSDRAGRWTRCSRPTGSAPA